MQFNFEILDTLTEPKDITRLLGIKPDKESLKGERNKELVLPRVNMWSIRSTVISDEAPDHWNELESILLPVKTKIEKLSREGEIQLNIIIDTEHRLPPIKFPTSMLKFLGDVNAVIDIDHMI